MSSTERAVGDPMAPRGPAAAGYTAAGRGRGEAEHQRSPEPLGLLWSRLAAELRPLDLPPLSDRKRPRSRGAGAHHRVQPPQGVSAATASKRGDPVHSCSPTAAPAGPSDDVRARRTRFTPTFSLVTGTPFITGQRDGPSSWIRPKLKERSQPATALLRRASPAVHSSCSRTKPDRRPETSATASVPCSALVPGISLSTRPTAQFAANGRHSTCSTPEPRLVRPCARSPRPGPWPDFASATRSRTRLWSRRVERGPPYHLDTLKQVAGGSPSGSTQMQERVRGTVHERERVARALHELA